jgi:hypothetical protein
VRVKERAYFPDGDSGRVVDRAPDNFDPDRRLVLPTDAFVAFAILRALRAQRLSI